MQLMAIRRKESLIRKIPQTYYRFLIINYQAICLVLFCLLPFFLSAQQATLIDTTSIDKLGPVDVNFLFSYYNQDGDHSAVTGGIGTQKLEDYASKIIINVPLNQSSGLNIQTHVNYYSSASSDRIGSRLSSASASDIRAQLHVEYTKENNSKNSSYALKSGGSIESDYISTLIGGGWTKILPDANKEIGIAGLAFFDTWHLFFPEELRGTAHRDIKTDKRRTLSLSLNYSQVITRRFQASLSSELIFQHGLLSTPFHRVYFSDITVPRIEKLPSSRVKFPISIRMNYFLGNHLITRLYYRFYADNFGIKANTMSLEIPVRFGKVFSVYPSYRFHIQTQSAYFKEYAMHLSDDPYYTSDFDLSSFRHHRISAGFSYSRNRGIRKLDENYRKFYLDQIGARYSRYFRSDGLRAFLITFHIGFMI